MALRIILYFAAKDNAWLTSRCFWYWYSTIGQAIAACERQFKTRYSLDFIKAQSGDYQSVVVQIADMQPH